MKYHTASRSPTCHNISPSPPSQPSHGLSVSLASDPDGSGEEREVDGRNRRRRQYRIAARIDPLQGQTCAAIRIRRYWEPLWISDTHRIQCPKRDAGSHYTCGTRMAPQTGLSNPPWPRSAYRESTERVTPNRWRGRRGGGGRGSLRRRACRRGRRRSVDSSRRGSM